MADNVKWSKFEAMIAGIAFEMYARKIEEAVRKADEEICEVDLSDKENQRRVKSNKAHGVLIGEGLSLFNIMRYSGATEEEMNKIVRYLLVVFNSQKHVLDWRKAKKYFGFKEIKAKYDPDHPSVWEP